MRRLSACRQHALGRSLCLGEAHGVCRSPESQSRAGLQHAELAASDQSFPVPALVCRLWILQTLLPRPDKKRRNVFENAMFGCQSTVTDEYTGSAEAWNVCQQSGGNLTREAVGQTSPAPALPRMHVQAFPDPLATLFTMQAFLERLQLAKAAEPPRTFTLFAAHAQIAAELIGVGL